MLALILWHAVFCVSFYAINTSGKKPDQFTHSFYTGLLSIRYSPTSLPLLTLDVILQAKHNSVGKGV